MNKSVTKNYYLVKHPETKRFMGLFHKKTGVGVTWEPELNIYQANEECKRNHSGRSLFKLITRQIKLHRRMRQPLDLFGNPELGNAKALRIKGYPELSLYTYGNVFIKPGEIMRITKERKKVLLDRPKKPRSKSFYVGVELEFTSDWKDSDIKTLLVDHDLHSFTQLKYDGSIEVHESDSTCAHCAENCSCDLSIDSHEVGCECNCAELSAIEESQKYGHELVILGSESKIADRVNRVIKLLETHTNSQVNPSCGMHVHLDCRNRDVEKVYTNLWAMQSLLYSMVPVSRFKNKYCQPSPYPSFEAQRDNCERYAGINARSFKEHKTVEVRIHSGTLNATKIINWITLLTKIAHASIPQEPTLNMEFLNKTLGLDYTLIRYIFNRMNKFKGERKGYVKVFARHPRLGNQWTTTPTNFNFPDLFEKEKDWIQPLLFPVGESGVSNDFEYETA